MGKKKCSICGKPFPNTRKHFHYLNKKLGMLRAECIDCRRKYSREHQKKYYEEMSESRKIDLLEIKRNRYKEYYQKNKNRISEYMKLYNAFLKYIKDGIIPENITKKDLNRFIKKYRGRFSKSMDK